MRILSKYLLRDLFRPMFLSLVLMLSIIWLMQSLRFMDLIINKGLDIATFLWITGLIIPTILIVLLPLALFAGTVYSFKRLNDDNELSALFAAGRSRWSIVSPAFWMGCCIVALCYIISLWLIPAGMTTFKSLQHHLRQSGGNLLLEEGTFNEFGDGITVYVKKRVGANELHSLLVHDNRDENRPITWMARNGKITFNSEGFPRLTLIKGARQELRDNSFNVLEFEKHTIDILKQINTVSERWRGSEERYLGELLDTEGLDERNINRFRAEFHKRLTWPLSPLVFILLAGICLIKTKERRLGSFRATACACGLAALYQAGIMTTHNLSTRGNDWAVIGQWALPLIIITICMFLLIRTHREVL